MGTIDEPQNERSRRTRAAALDATWQLIEEAGPKRVTMASVAERAGISRRALYLHFPSRAELLLALHHHLDEVLDLEASAAPIRDAADGEEALVEFVGHLARFHTQIARIDLALLAAAGDPEVDALLAKGAKMWRDGCGYVVKRLATEGRLAEPWTVATATDLLWTFMFPETLQRLTTDRDWSVEQYRELLTVVVCRALLDRTHT